MKKLILLLVFLFSPSLLAQEQTLIGGVPVRPGEYPEVIRISDGSGYCTASIVGEKVILTAAHCSKENGEIVPVSEDSEYQFVFEQNVYKAKCSLAPSYRNGRTGVGSEDIALCKIDRKVDVKYAIVSTDEPQIDDTVTLIGYGCIRGRNSEGGAGGGNDGILRVGDAIVYRNSTDNYHHWHADRGASLCYGDSGGPAFFKVENPKDDYHYIAGVNSMGDIESYSLLTSTKQSIGFFKAYELTNKVEICGISADCNKKPDPKPDPDDTDECIEEKYKVWRYGKLLNEWQLKLDRCLAIEDIILL